MFARNLASAKGLYDGIPRHRIIEDDLYDDREACIGSRLSNSSLSLKVAKMKDNSETYIEFHNIWKQSEDEPLLLAQKYSALTNEYLASLPRPDSKALNSHLFEATDLERSAWHLLFALYSDRLRQVDSPLNEVPLKSHCHSEREIVNNLYDTDNDLRETQIIIDWLEGKIRDEIVKVAEKYECLFNETTVWENTRNLLDTLTINDLKSRRLVTQLAQRLCLQRGDITRAIAMEGWRPFHSSYLSDEAQSENPVIEGNTTRVLSKCVAWLNAENPALNSYERAMFAAQSGHLDALLQAMTCGSWEDILWAHCRALVESRVDATLRTKLDCGPRADTLSVFGRPQKGFELEDIGLQLPDSAWLPGSWTLSEAFSKAETVLGWCPLKHLIRVAEEGYGFSAPTLPPSEISAFLNHNLSHNIKASGDSSFPGNRQMLLKAVFYSIFRGLALREYSDLLAALASVASLFIPPLIRQILASGITNANWPDQLTLDVFDCQVLRFLAHFVICLKCLENCLPDEPCNTVLEAYITTLIVERRFSLVASYIARLSTPVRQTRWYASFLSSLKKPEDRHQCLEYAESAGLNVRNITRAVIRIVRRRFDEQEGVDKSALSATAPLPTANRLTDLVGGDVVAYLTQVDKARIAALDWLAHDRAQRGELLILANSLLRLFIAMRKLCAAKALLDRLPLALLEQLKLKLLQAEEEFGTDIARNAVPPWLSNAIREHECLILYIRAREAFDQWYVHINSAKPTPPLVENGADAFRSLAERVAAEEAERNFRVRLECWNHEVELSSSSLLKQLESLLTYESPGWLVDAPVLYSAANTSTNNCDVTGMFDSTPLVVEANAEEDQAEEASEGLGIAGLGDSPHARKLQMNILRETCLREVVFMMVKVLKLTGRHAECVLLATLVADPHYGIFKLFNECQMQTLLEQLQDSMLFLQENCGDALGYGDK